MNNKFCTNCGNPLKEGVKFCPNCGQAVAIQATSQSFQSQSKSQSELPPKSQGAYQEQSYTQPQSFSAQPSAFEQAKEYYEQTKRLYSQPTTQELGFIGSFKYFLVHWLDFKSMEPRKSVYWWSVLGTLVVELVGWILCLAVNIIPILGQIISVILIIALIVFGIVAGVGSWAAAVRRMRYLNVQNIAIWVVLSILLGLPSFYILYLMLLDRPLPPRQYQAPYPPQQNDTYQQPMMNQNFTSSEQSVSQNTFNDSQNYQQ